jgi:diaminohydroxyphosphoribosylaminopyrimidine deaminase/5-amino-6-(5-phosphoribosylamino)uracil reductase
LQTGLVDELVIYMAPHLMGDRARGLFSLPALRHMHQRVDLEIIDLRAVGKDWRIVAKPVGVEQ